MVWQIQEDYERPAKAKIQVAQIRLTHKNIPIELYRVLGKYFLIRRLRNIFGVKVFYKSATF